MERINDLIVEVIENYPRLTGLLLGVAAHPIFAALLR